MNKYRGMSLAQLRDELETLERDIRALHYDESGDLRDLTPDETHRLNLLLADQQYVSATIKRHQTARESYLRNGAETAFGKRGPGVVTRDDTPHPGDVERMDGQQVRYAAQALLERSSLQAAEGDRVDELLRTHLTAQNRSLDGSEVARRILLTENDAYRSAFMEILKAGQRGVPPILTAEEAAAVRQFQAFEESRAMAIGTPSLGGMGVPVFIDASILLTGQQGPEYNDLLRVSRVIQITTDRWKGVSSAGVTWSFDPEAAEVSDDSPTLAQPEIPVHTARGFIPYSIEVGMDYPGFAEEMQKLLSEGFMELAGEKVTVGSGTGEPKGILTALDSSTYTEVVVTTAGSLPAAEIYKVWEALPKRARPRSSWMSSVSIQNKVRQLSATSTGTQDANFTVDMTADSVQRLFGKPYYLNEWFDDFVNTTGNQNWAVVGDFSKFAVVQRAGMSIEAVQHLVGTNHRPTGQRGFFAWARLGSDLLEPLSPSDRNSLRLLKNKPS